MEFRSTGVQRLVRDERNTGRILSKCRKRVIEVVFAVKVRDIRGPEFPGFRALLFDPLRNLIEDKATQRPMVKIPRTSDRDLALLIRFCRGEQVPRIPILRDGRIVCIFNIS